MLFESNVECMWINRNAYRRKKNKEIGPKVTDHKLKVQTREQYMIHGHEKVIEGQVKQNYEDILMFS